MTRIESVYPALGAALLGLCAAVAQANTDFAIEEVVVTAQKRAQSLVDVPASVQALTGSDLENAGIHNVEDLTALSPSLALQDSMTPWQKSVYIRGVGTNVNSITVEPSVSAVLDGVVLARQGQFFAELADIERIEVLRGPQSTLFGKNASAGVLSIVTKKPNLDETEGLVDFSYNEFNELKVKGTYSAPINESMAYRLSGNFKDGGDSPIENVNPEGPSLDGGEAYALRGKLLWDASEDVEVLFSADYSQDQGPAGVRVFRQVASPAVVNQLQQGASQPIVAGVGNRAVSLNDKNDIEGEDWGLSAEVNWSWGEHDVTSITAYRSWEMTNNIDIDSLGADAAGLSLAPALGGGIPYFRGRVYTEKQTSQFSQELRLASSGAGDLQYVLGAFLWMMDLEDTGGQSRDLCFGGGPLVPQLGVPCDQVVPVSISPVALTQSASSITRADTEYFALFGQADYLLNDDVTLTLGGRLQHETFEYDQRQLGVMAAGDVPFIGFEGRGKVSNSVFTGKAGIQYALNDDSNAYFSYSRGYKGPGLNSGSFQPVDNKPLAGETVDALELGYKARLMGGRLSLNAALFWQEFDDPQVRMFDPEQNTLVATNAGATRQRGLELDSLFMATRELALNASVTFLDAEYLEFSTDCYFNDPNPQCAVDGSKDVSGETMTYSPDWKLSLGGRYVDQIPGTQLNGFAQLNYRWQSQTQYSTNQSPNTLQDSYGVADLSFGVEEETGRYKVTFFIRNLLDKQYATNLGVVLDSTGQGETVTQFVPHSANRYFGGSVQFGF